MSREIFQERFNVSRETLEAFDAYAQLLQTWAKRINLISLTTIDDIWLRHFANSAQILSYLGKTPNSLVDFGSGAGFPGLVLAKFISLNSNDYEVTLIDENYKRISFLREAARVLGVKINLICDKIDKVEAKKYEIVTARAFAPLQLLLPLSKPYYDLGARLVYLKGEDVDKEVLNASTKWDFKSKTDFSIAEFGGCILEISELKSVE